MINKCLEAVRRGNLSEFKNIITTEGISLSSLGQSSCTLLCLAVQNNHKAMTEFLIQSGAKVNNNNSTKKRKTNKQTPLHYAARNGRKDIVELLLNNGANIEAKNEYGGAALQTAVYHKNIEIIELLLQRGASVDAKKNDGTTSLHTAIDGGNLNVIEILLKHNANGNEIVPSRRKVSERKTPLHIAAEKGQDKIVDLLIKYNVSIDVKTRNGSPPIWLATMHGHSKIVQILLQHGANVDSQNIKENKTILGLAVENGSVEIVDHILKHDPDVENPLNKCSVEKALKGTTSRHQEIFEKLLNHGFPYVVNHDLLIWATKNECMEIVEKCLQTNAKTLLTSVPKQSSPLHLACHTKNIHIVEMLIHYGANVNDTDKFGKTPIFYTAMFGHTEIMKLLLANKASATSCPDLMMYAVRNDNKEMVHLLLSHNVNVKESNSNDGKTALHYCAHINCGWDSLLLMNAFPDKITTQSTQIKNEIAKILLKAGADVNAVCNEGKSTLHYACFKGCELLVEVLLNNGAQMFGDRTGEMPIHMNAITGNLNILKLLISHGADVNAKANNKKTPIHLAAHQDQNDYVKYLLENGANADDRDNEGLTPLHIAAKNDHFDIVELLLKYGADIDAIDNRGCTALFFATRSGNRRVARTLLEFGCNTDLQKNKTPNLTNFETNMLQSVHFIANFFNNFLSDDENDISDFDDDIYDGLDLDDDDDDSPFDDYYDYMGSDADYYDSDMDMELNPDDIGVGYDGDQISAMMKEHYIMMQAANLSTKNEAPTAGLSDESSKILNNAFLKIFKTKCEEEIAKLKCNTILPDNNVTYYDILKKPIDMVAIYVRNPNISQVFETNNFKTEYPIYAGFLNGKIVRAIHRKNLLDRGNVFFDLLAIRLPYNCTENICSYLNDKDLKILSEVNKPKNV